MSRQITTDIELPAAPARRSAREVLLFAAAAASLALALAGAVALVAVALAGPYLLSAILLIAFVLIVLGAIGAAG